MSTLWIAPLMVAVVGFVTVAFFARRLAEEAAAFRRSVTRVGELQPALVEVRTAAQALRAAAAELRRR